MRLEWLEALVKLDVEIDISSSQEDEEFIWTLFHACLVVVSFQEEERVFAWRYHQFNGVVVEVATVLPPHSSVIFISLVSICNFLSFLISLPFIGGINGSTSYIGVDIWNGCICVCSLSLCFLNLMLWGWGFMEGIAPF